MQIQISAIAEIMPRYQAIELAGLGVHNINENKSRLILAGGPAE